MSLRLIHASILILLTLFTNNTFAQSSTEPDSLPDIVIGKCAADNAQCLYRHWLSTAISECKNLIVENELENRGAYNYKWTSKKIFDDYELDGIELSFYGKALKVQNKFGVWRQLSYVCVISIYTGGRIDYNSGPLVE